MTDTCVMILEGSNGQSFFFKETLLAEGLAEHVQLVGCADDAIDLLRHGNYNLVVINLVEAWEEGMQLGFWLSQRSTDCPVILIISPELEQPLPSTNGAFIILTEPLSLRSFAASVRKALQPSVDNHQNIQDSMSLWSSGLPSWSGGPLHQEYSGYWSPYSNSFLS